MSDMIVPQAGNETQTPQGSQGALGRGAADFIKDTTTREFKADVMDQSRLRPVIVDFWAPWCGPCKQLTPVLEKVVGEARGAVRLVKLNIDEHPGIAGQMGIQSIPAVFAFVDGKPVDGFMGAQGESEVRAFVQRLTGARDHQQVAAVLGPAQQALDAGDLGAAARGFAAALQLEAQNPDAIGGLAQCYLKAGDLDKARSTLALAAPDIAGKPAIAGARAALELADQAASAGDIGTLRAALAADPAAHQTRLDLAIALNASGDKDGATDELLHIIRHARTWNDEAARKQLLQFFDAWGPGEEATRNGRRKLSSLLFA